MTLMKEKEIILDSLKRQLNDLREEMRIKDEDLERLIKKQMEDERDRGAFERKEKSKLQKELEILEKNYQELEL